jgi:hypothetical protein
MFLKQFLGCILPLGTVFCAPAHGSTLFIVLVLFSILRQTLSNCRAVPVLDVGGQAW